MRERGREGSFLPSSRPPGLSCVCVRFPRPGDRVDSRQRAGRSRARPQRGRLCGGGPRPLWSGLVWSGEVWSGLVWSGLVRSGLVWSGSLAGLVLTRWARLYGTVRGGVTPPLRHGWSGAGGAGGGRPGSSPAGLAMSAAPPKRLPFPARPNSDRTHAPSRWHPLIDAACAATNHFSDRPGPATQQPVRFPQDGDWAASRGQAQLGRRLPRCASRCAFAKLQHARRAARSFSTRALLDLPRRARTRRCPGVPRWVHEHCDGADGGVRQRPAQGQVRRYVYSWQQRCSPTPTPTPQPPPKSPPGAALPRVCHPSRWQCCTSARRRSDESARAGVCGGGGPGRSRTPPCALTVAVLRVPHGRR